ncbi:MULTISPECIES: precorrin-3B C(17)-methyltransferase [Caloramator]|jgi:precorrin-3B C17-methyltransferase|uniref:Cobalt-precorrin-3b C17-methyltransferase n=1 Tax=Caloramator australicus RC3 TaxID=857293 RepID=I7LJU2_9CLOT|nr:MULTISPECIES: precorrin-3B C(17)-methyltransferase [Caloramator]MDO6353644.1 precorrin-3B C(17)-methyltransferase [Caloramator sp. CAR-1]CCJ33943.1 Cobalt-precorrin-3b C17-methyltransferase [Caloramator australicus RC3]
MAKLYVIGIGSGQREDMTLRAVECIKKCQVIVGYDFYIELIKDFIKDKVIIKTSMKSEVERCRLAISKVKEGYDTGVISSGDSGLYGMAGLLLELNTDIEYEIIPGVTSAFLAAASLGAPIMHDFCSISLSDLLTPWQIIEKRIKAAAEGDFVIALYNPKSSARVYNLNRALEIILRYRNPKTFVGIVKNARRYNEEKIITTLDSINLENIDMRTILIIGNSMTYVKDGYMITPRGYII